MTNLFSYALSESGELLKNGLPAVCPYTFFRKENFSGTYELPKCNSACAMFNMVSQENDIIEAHLRCGSGNKFTLDNVKVNDKTNNSVIRKLQ